MISQLKFVIPEEWAEPFRMAMMEVCDANICIIRYISGGIRLSEMGEDRSAQRVATEFWKSFGGGAREGEALVALTSSSLPQISLEHWAEKAYAVTAAGMFRHRDREDWPSLQTGLAEGGAISLRKSAVEHPDRRRAGE